MKYIFKGKVALVTGGSGGIGLDVSRKLAQLKIKVLILDIKQPKIKKNKFIYFEKVDLSNEIDVVNKYAAILAIDIVREWWEKEGQKAYKEDLFSLMRK